MISRDSTNLSKNNRFYQKIIATIIVVVVIINQLYSQNTDSADYAKFRIGISVNYYLEGNSYYSQPNTPVTYRYNNFIAHSFGYYNLGQIERFSQLIYYGENSFYNESYNSFMSHF